MTLARSLSRPLYRSQTRALYRGPSDDGITYHISFSEGNDSTGDGSLGAPYKTFAGMIADITALAPGDVVGFKRGDTWTNHTAWIQSSGTADDWIEIRDYGDPGDPIPHFHNGGQTGTNAQNFRVSDGNTYVRFRNLHCIGASNAGDGKGIFCGNTTGTRAYFQFYGCNIGDIGAADPSNRNNIGLSTDYNVDVYMEDCICMDSVGKGLSLHLDATNAPHVHAVRCTFKDNGTYGAAVVDTIADADSQWIFEDCIFENNSGNVNNDVAPTTPASAWSRFVRCYFRGRVAANYGRVRAHNATYEYCIFDYTLLPSSQYIIQLNAFGTAVFRNCTIVAPVGTARGRIEAGTADEITLTAVNCAFLDISRINRFTTGLDPTDAQLTHCRVEGIATTDYFTNNNPITAVSGQTSSLKDRTAYDTLGYEAFAPLATSVLLAANRNETTSVVAEYTTTDIMGNALPGSNPTVGAIQNSVSA